MQLWFERICRHLCDIIAGRRKIALISKELLDRINELARKSREEGLTGCEEIEQQRLRKEYVTAFRGRVQSVLENTYIQDPDGTKKKLEKKD